MLLALGALSTAFDALQSLTAKKSSSLQATTGFSQTATTPFESTKRANEYQFQIFNFFDMISPIFSRDTSLVIASVGGVVSIVTVRGEEATETLPAVSAAFAVSVCIPSASVALVMLQLPLPSASAAPSTVVPPVS